LDTSILQCFAILTWVSAANAATGVDVDEFAEAEYYFINLLGQLTGRGKDDGLTLWTLGINSL
jgi:hypothetical protein